MSASLSIEPMSTVILASDFVAGAGLAGKVGVLAKAAGTGLAGKVGVLCKTVGEAGTGATGALPQAVKTKGTRAMSAHASDRERM